jgi:hypothetical protein
MIASGASAAEVARFSGRELAEPKIRRHLEPVHEREEDRAGADEDLRRKLLRHHVDLNGGPPAWATMLVKPHTAPQNQPRPASARVGASVPGRRSTTRRRIAKPIEMTPTEIATAASET